MSNYSVLKQDINNNIYENQTQQITGTVLNAILNEMTNSLGAGYQFAGVATLGMNPGDPDQRVFYLAGEGIYTNFGGIQVPAGKLGVLKWDNRWTLQTIDGLGGGGANLTGYVSVASTDDLPDEGQPTLGYLCGTNLYLYVGEGGDTKEGKYQDCGSFRGPQGDSVQDVEQTQTSLENGGVNKIKFTLSNGISCEFQVRNGTTSSGLFPTVEALQAAYPSPVVGQYAFVGAGFPADIYVCTTAGTWTDSGEDYDGDNVDLTDYATKAEVNQLEAKVNNADLLVERQIDVASQAKRSYFLNLDTQTYGTTSTYKHCVVDLEGAKMVRIQAGAEEDAQIAFFTSFDIASSGGSAPMLPTYYTITAGTTKTISVPIGAVALYFYAGISSTGYKYAPAKVVFIGASVDSIDEQLESGYIIPTVREASGIRIESTVAVASGNTIKFFPVKLGDVLVVDFTHSGTYLRQGFTSVTPGTGAEVTSYTALNASPTGRLRLTAPFDGFYCASDVTNGISVFSPKIIRGTLANEVLKVSNNPIKTENVADFVNPLQQIDIMSLTKQSGGLNGAGCFSYGSTYKFILLPVSAGGRLRIVSAYGTEAILAWFNQLPESTTGNAFAPFVENTARFTVSGDETFTVPEGAMYLYIYLGSSPYEIAPTFVGYAQPLSSSSSAMIDNSDTQTIEVTTRRTARALTIGLKPLSYNLDENGWEIPQTLQQLNAIKKAKQLCNIKWTPKSSVPLPNGTASAGVQRTGVNYSSPVEFEKYVGVGVSFHTFMTALNNPYSLQYTENINDDDSTSIWGFTYKDGKGYAYYGTACNGFVCACLEMVIEYANNAYPGRLTDAMIVTPLVPQSVDFFQIGDIIDTNTHAIMIYGIRRDSDGNAVGFKTAESTSAYNGCIIKDYTREELVGKITLSGFIAYRYNELWKNWDYKPSPYVPIDDEPEQIVTYNDDICTFAGDEASFRVGDLVVLNYNLSDSPSHNWTGIEVYKDDVLIDTYLLSAIDQDALPVGQRGHALKLGTSLEAGKYKARLTDGENYYSDYTKWEVLSVVSTVLEKDNECLGVTIEAESNATPKYVMVGTVSGDSFTSLKGRLLTDEEIESGHFDLYINGVGRDNPLYIRFIADGDYGRVRTLPEVTEPTI